MELSEIQKLLKNIQKEYKIYAPVQDGKEFFVQKIDDLKQVEYSGQIPLNSWKHLLVPPCEKLFDFDKNFERPKSEYPKICAWNMTIQDLKALGLFDVVFENDPYYQERRQNILVCGLSVGEPDKENYSEYLRFSYRLKEDVLEHLTFDLFFEKSKKGRASWQAGNFEVYSGSEKGRKFLEIHKIKDYNHVQFAGYIPEEGPSQDMINKEKLIRESINHKLWDELDKICIACGKCSLVCPTCFCFDTEDESQEKSISRKRVWGSCFYPEFTQMAGGANYTDTPKKKLRFWYEHKFIRIPAEYKMPGCVSCGRCSKVCPVGIDIIENFNRLKKGQE